MSSNTTRSHVFVLLVAVLLSWGYGGNVASKEGRLQGDPQRHWAFQPPRRPSLPVDTGEVRSSNPIDLFVAAEHRRRGLTAVPLADKETLLRRVSLDLVGLAPTREQLRRFLDDMSGDAYERLVDRLLESPQYGERWGRHWMDVWRYSDSFGILGQRSQKHIWHWRDWIIESLNGDKGYDRMIVEMLAADEFAPTDADALRATGFVARNYFHFNRDVWLDSTIEHTSKAFLGLTLNCCRCHDHKYDPITQRDYYALRAVFEPHRIRTDRLPGEPDLKKRGIPRIFDADLDVPTWIYEGGNAKRPKKEDLLSPDVPEVFDFVGLVVEPVPLPGVAYYPALRPFVVAETLAAAREAVTKAQDQCKESATSLAKKRLVNTQLALVALEARIAAEEARHVTRSPSADALARDAAVAERTSHRVDAELKVLEGEQRLSKAHQALKAGKESASGGVIAAETELAEAWARLDEHQGAAVEAEASYSNLGRIFPAESSGRRLALARWITHPRNPLAARVAVNHVWLRHFGQGLVGTVFDFGHNGSSPSHPRLLDWLAVEFIEQGWSMKRLHRTIVTSHAYRRSSSSRTAGARTLDSDPDNRWLWRANSRRMESQIIRDNVFHLSERLDRRMGGAEIDPKEMETIARRSVYFRHSERDQIPFLAMFDDASVNECYRREETIVPQQALAMANSRLVLTASRELAQRLASTASVEFIVAAFEAVLSRSPTEAERETCQSAIWKIRESLTRQNKKDPSQLAREYLVHVLFNHNDFVTIR